MEGALAHAVVVHLPVLQFGYFDEPSLKSLEIVGELAQLLNEIACEPQSFYFFFSLEGLCDGFLGHVGLLLFDHHGLDLVDQGICVLHQLVEGLLIVVHIRVVN